MNRIARKGLIRLFGFQLLVTVVLSVACGVMAGIKGAYSAGLGGLICIVPNIYFAMKLFKHQGARSAKRIVQSFYKGEALKLLITIVLFAVVFVNIPLSAPSFFISFIVVQWLFWFAPWLFDKQ